MRTRTLTERNRIKAQTVNHHLRVEVQNIDRTWKELTDMEGVDWVDTAEIRNSLDQPCAQFTLNLRRNVTEPDDAFSLAPTWGGSPLNRDDTGLVYAPLLDAGRNVRIWSAVTARGVVPVEDDWKLMLHGRIDTVAWERDPVVVTGRDLSGWLINTFIELEIAYATDDPTAVEVIMQAILDDWPSGVIDVPTLDTPLSPGWIFSNSGDPPKTQAMKNVLEALQQDWALSIGWQCRYVYDDTAEDFVLRFYMIDRDKVDPDDEFAPEEYKDITTLKITDEFVRNRIYGSCFGPDGEKIELIKENLTSQGKYGVKYAGINLAQGDPVDSEEELDTLLEAAVHDLGAPFAQQTMETLLYWPIELGDLYNFKANSDHYDDDQRLAVVAYTHRWSKGEAWTTMDCNGQVIGSFHSWFRKGVGDVITEAEESIGLNNWKHTDSSDGLSRTYEMTAGANVFRVAVFLNTKAIPNTVDPWPDDAVSVTTMLTPDPVTRIVTYTVSKPDSAHEIYVQFEARLDDLSINRDVLGVVRRDVLQANPSALTAALHGDVSNATVDLSADIKGSSADWPVLVEFFADNPSGSPFASKSVSADSTLTKLTSGLSALGGLSLPQRESRRFYVKMTNVAEEVRWGESIAVDRDSLPYGYVTLNDYRAAPVIKVNYDDDTDEVKIYLPGGKTKTFTGLTGAGVVTYTVGDLPDLGSAESALSIDESRSGYQVDVHGGGQYITIWGGALQGTLHGLTTGPSLQVQSIPGPTSFDIEWSGQGTITLSIDGGSFSTPPASPILGIARDATNDIVYRFKSVQAGATIENSVVIPSLQKDMVTPDLSVTPGTPAVATQPFTVSASNPSGGAAPTITVTPFNCSMVIAGLTYTTVQTVVSGTVVTVNRPSTITDTQAHVKFDAAIAGGGSESIDVEIVSQLNFGPTLNVQVNPGGTPTADASIVWSGSGTITVSIDGAAYTTPSASPITVARHATLDKTYTFKAVKDGQDIVNTVTVPSLKSDGLVPNLSVSVGTATATTQPYTPTFSNPRTGGTAPTGGVTAFGAATFNINGGTTFGASDGQQSFNSGDVITVNRPSSTTTTKSHIRFRASISGGGSEELTYPILPQLNVGPILVVTPTPGDSNYSIAYSGTGTITYSVDGGSYTTPGASPLSISRTSHDQTITFKCERDGQSITATVVVPALRPPTSTAFSVSASAFFSPCDGTGTCSVDVSGGSFPDGITYDAIVSILSGTFFGTFPVTTAGFTPGSAGNVNGKFCSGEDARVTVVVRYGGEVIASASTDFTS